MIDTACTTTLPQRDKSTYIGSHYPLPQDGILPAHSAPTVLPPKGLTLTAKQSRLIPPAGGYILLYLHAIYTYWLYSIKYQLFTFGISVSIYCIFRASIAEERITYTLGVSPHLPNSKVKETVCAQRINGRNAL